MSRKKETGTVEVESKGGEEKDGWKFSSTKRNGMLLAFSQCGGEWESVFPYMYRWFSGLSYSRMLRQRRGPSRLLGSRLYAVAILVWNLGALLQAG